MSPLSGVLEALPILLLVAALSYWFLRKGKATSSGLADIPGATPTDKSAGNVKDIAAAGSLHQYLIQLHNKYGDICTFWFFGHQVVSVAKAEYFKDTLKLINRPVELFALFQPLIGENSLQYLNGPAAQEKRKLLDKFFTTSATKRYYPVFLTSINNMISNWNTRLVNKPEAKIELSKEMLKVALHIIVRVIFGTDFDSEEEVQQLSEAYHICWSEMEKRLVSSPDAERQKTFEKNPDFMYSVVQKCINKRREFKSQQAQQQKKKNYGDDDEIEESNFLDLLFEVGYSDEIIKADAVTYLIGGFHTTANFLTWVLYFIARDHDLQQKLYSEVVDVVGISNEVDFEKLGRLDFLAMVLNETLRYIVIAPYAARFSNEEEKIGKYTIPKNTKIVHALGALSHNPSSWENPDHFDTYHFSKEASEKRNPLAFVPFGVGVRTCPAQRFSIIEGKAIVAKFIQKFNFSVDDPEKDVEPEWGLVAQPKNEIILRISKR